MSTPEREVRLLTVAEYLALGETELGYDELVEGRVFMSPSPGPDHNRALFRVAVQLEPQLPRELEVLLDLDVDLQLAPPDAPGFTRRPDLIVARRSARERVRREGGIIRAAEIEVAAEFVSPGSKRTDHVAKRADYARAGVTGCDSVREALAGRRVVFSMVTADQALVAAGSAASHLERGALYFDCNSCAPETKRRAAALVDAAGGRYVDVAVMGAVHPTLHRTLVLLSGPHAATGLGVAGGLGVEV